MNSTVRVDRGPENLLITQTDDAGEFTARLPVGRYKLTVSYTGYKTRVEELLVIAGKESILILPMAESSHLLESVEIASTPLAAEVPGMRSLSIEKTLRIPANFFDPVRVATAYPGVMATNDQNNSIIVRGNSPNGLLWRLNGLDVINPNHQANAGTFSDKPTANGGGVNILSAQMLDRTDFYVGAFPADFGNALSGVVDMKLRAGNKEQFEYTGQASLIGLDFAVEGPVGRKQNTSILANYRYSTVGLLSQFGVNFGGESINFQDLSFHLNSDLENGSLSVFGFWGSGTNEFNHKPLNEWKEDKDRYDIDYSSVNAALGMNYKVKVGAGNLSGGFAYSYADQDRTAVSSFEVPSLPTEVHLISDNFSQNNGLLSGKLAYQLPLGKQFLLDAGLMANGVYNTIESAREFGCWICSFRQIRRYDGATDGFLLQPFANLRMSLSRAISVNAGMRYLYFTFNNTYSAEPRVSANVAVNERSSVDVSYGLVSQVQLPQVVGQIGNRDLGFTRSHHMDAAFTHSPTDGIHLRTGIFYQYLFDVPIVSPDVDPESSFSVLNLNEEPAPFNLVNEGTGRNYGVDLTLEKLFYRDHYFLFGGSYYQSKYTPADGIERNTRFNGRFTLSSVYGKEWSNPDKHRSIGLNTRILYLGGLLLRDVNIAASEVFLETIYSDNFAVRMNDYFRVDLRLSFRKNKPGYTRTFAIDIQNVTNQQNEAFQYYDFVQGDVVKKYQLGIIPVLVYRIDF